MVSERYAETFAALDHGAPMTLVLGDEYERALSVAPASEPPPIGEPEDGYLILYTSGTTGLPKGALISQRAAIARTTVFVIDRITVPGRTHIAWAPLCHIVATDPSLATLLNGGKVIVIDGADVGRILEFAAVETIDHLMVVPGIVERFLKEARATNFRPFSVTTVGCMADLVPRHQIAELTELMQAPYRNSFGMTETAQIATAGVVPIGVVPERLSKTQSSLCRIRLVDANDEEVPDGEPGEVAYRGPSLFSGYWNNQSATEHDFRGGWFHTGDVLVRNPDGTLDFVDRRKYLIKSGGEIYIPPKSNACCSRHRAFETPSSSGGQIHNGVRCRSSLWCRPTPRSQPMRLSSSAKVGSRSIKSRRPCTLSSSTRCLATGRARLCGTFSKHNRRSFPAMNKARNQRARSEKA
jgi:acyl-CoA synthetase (AMP-forming)/AMP-acid ligase II